MTPTAPLELVILVGVQGSGKSTFARTRFTDTHVFVSKDLMPNNRNKARRQAQLIEQALEAGRSVILDNTNPTPEDRAGPIELARTHGAAVTGYFFPTDVHAAVRRNHAREGRARVPDVAIYATAKKLTPPTPDEGFTRLYAVRLADAGAYDIIPWNAHEEQ